MLTLTEERYRRGLVAMGAAAPRAAFRRKLDEHRPIVFGAIGGSITAGAGAAARRECFVERLGAALSGRTECRVVNAGIGASNSLFGAFRAGRDLLCHHPDLVTVEYAVNDLNNPEVEASYEALLRQCLSCESHPLVVLIFTMRPPGRCQQAVQERLGRHYGLPMFSVRDMLTPELESGSIQWDDYSADDVHPRPAGHALIAAALTRMLCDEAVGPEPEHALPPRMFARSAPFEGGRVIEAAAFDVAANAGWRLENGCWAAEQPGARLVIRFRGPFAALGCMLYTGGFGRIAAAVDDRHAQILDGYYPNPIVHIWRGGHTVPYILGDDLDGTIEHRLKIRLLADHHAESNGTCFKMHYLLVR